GKKLHVEQKADHWSFDAAFSSPTSRAKITAETILAEMDHDPFEVIQDARLHERHSGKFDGKKMDEAYHTMRARGELEIESLNNLSERLQYKFDPTDEKEESILDVLDRTLDFLEEKHSDPQTSGKTLLITTHNYVMRALVMAELGNYYHSDI